MSQAQYGAPEDSFQGIAQAWSAYLGIHINKRQVAMMLILMKVMRDKNKTKRDNLVDIIGYAYCASKLGGP